MKKIILSILLFSATILGVKAQDIAYPQGKFFTIGVGLPMSFSNDKAISPLWYLGSGIEFKVGFLKNTATSCNRFDIVIGSIKEKPVLKPKPKFSYSGADFSNMKFAHSYYKKVGGNIHQDVLVGGQFCVQVALRSHEATGNNRLGFMLFTGLKAGAMTRGHHDAKWSYTSNVNIPIIGMLGRPTYIGLPDIEFKVSPGPMNFFKNVKLVTLNKYRAIDVNIEVNQQQKAWKFNRYTGNFSYQYTPSPKGKPLKMGQYSLGYDFMVKR